MGFATLGAPAYAAPGQELKPQVAVPPVVPASAASTADLPASGTARLTQADAEAWLDGFMPYAMARGDIAGAVVVVVKDGQVLVQKGYGYSDVAKRKPVDPETTLFRPGSVSKLFTWTAVMQLVEQGKLDLDRDVNDYLDFKIPARDGKPITLRQAMTHTTGLEETARALITSDPKEALALDAYLKHWVPTRIYDPGVTPAYSNYATSLAGYIVQRVSGQGFDDYIEQHLFQPLGMKHASFRQPLPAALQPLMSQGYKLGSDDKPQGYEIVNSAPAGSLAASGADMGRFMIAHLQKGEFQGNRILQAATADKMHTTALDILPPLNRMELGFYDSNINGHRSIAHAGDTQWFHSALHLFPDDNVGLFVSVNSSGKEGAPGVIRTALFEEFADRYFPGPVAEGKVDETTAKEHAAQIAGRYDNSRRSETGFVALAYLMGQVTVQANEDGTITVPALTGANGQPKKWREIAPYVWRDVMGGDRIAAKVVDGKVVRFSAEPISPFMVFDRTPAWRSGGLLLPLLGVALLALLLTVLAWPVSAMVRRHYGVSYPYSGRDAQWHRRIRWTSLVVFVTTVFGIGLVLWMMESLEMLGPRSDNLVHAIRLLAAIVLPLGALVSLGNAWAVLTSRRSWKAKLWSVVLAASCLVILWVGFVFNLIGFSANY
ncbi:serine hydrolase domain-containing protein [Lysobacter sp. LF1]|uniref:Serine hydrolase domain-containing protein n=1 Tax=Lysobacter stagni TaxID=3045172 RepID=A0ABT6XI29_9GAMM|nr:serine hydrolase domain-containing protein [Lysobacter sp. LF1]MDI9239815.1 serine hydrolase domain-containing protein [Lysobacter sp. LF1]